MGRLLVTTNYYYHNIINQCYDKYNKNENCPLNLTTLGNDGERRNNWIVITQRYKVKDGFCPKTEPEGELIIFYQLNRRHQRQKKCRRERELFMEQSHGRDPNAERESMTLIMRINASSYD